MSGQDARISEIVAGEGSRLRNFVRRRVPDPSDVEDIVQEVLYELVRANRLLMPIDHVVGWLFQVARNRIVDRWRSRRPEISLSHPVAEPGEALFLAELLPSPEVGPAEAYARSVLLDALEEALDALPEEQRAVFVAHEVEGLSFREIAARTGVGVSTLLSRKRYAVLRLRERLRHVYDELIEP